MDWLVNVFVSVQLPKKRSRCVMKCIVHHLFVYFSNEDASPIDFSQQEFDASLPFTLVEREVSLNSEETLQQIKHVGDIRRLCSTHIHNERQPRNPD
jgi:hypothetical protein